jgi:hypothetical protein
VDVLLFRVVLSLRNESGWVIFKVCLNGTYSNVRMSKHLPYKLSVQDGLKQGDGLSPLFQFCCRYAVGKVLE